VKILVLVDKDMERWDAPEVADYYGRLVESWNPSLARIPGTRQVEPKSRYALDVRRSADKKILIEIAPTMGEWAPFLFAIPLAEKEDVHPVLHFPHGDLVGYRKLQGVVHGPSWIILADNSAKPGHGYEITLNAVPSLVYFGVLESQCRQFTVFAKELNELLEKSKAP
jgi:hypothetical protein